ncbi:beta family protein [Streptomyces longwoodensis]|uniref:beta family protein n=1 Tax=Streptomyces longwoodensis TaxID=68231 RepID=UPI003F5437A0
MRRLRHTPRPQHRQGSGRRRPVALRTAAVHNTERTFLLARFWAEKRGETGATREVARWITGFPDFRSSGAITGDRWYEQCARTTGAKGTGNAGTWNTMGNIQHITDVAR